MEVRLEMDNWIINDEYFITEGVYGYEVYNCGTDQEEAIYQLKAIASNEYNSDYYRTFWNVLQKITDYHI